MPRRTLPTEGYSKIPNRIGLDRGVSLAGRGMLCVVLAFDWGDGCFASIGTLALHGGCSRATARTLLRELEGAGYLRREDRAGRASVYWTCDVVRPKMGVKGG